jgi:Ca2+-binding EF-hand superfamily protein
MFRVICLFASLALPAAVHAQKAAPSIPRTQFVANMDAQFRKMDADKNGQLSRTEIEQYQKLTAVAEAQARNRALFTQLDADKDGQLSQTEFAKVTAPVAAANAAPMLARMDGNRDQSISLIEHRTATLANFDKLDTDKDSIVTPAEMKAGGIGK